MGALWNWLMSDGARRAGASLPRVVVQLHRVEYHRDGPDIIRNSWQPIVVYGWEKARAKASELRSMNRWANATSGPRVTVTGPDGVMRCDAVLSSLYRGTDRIDPKAADAAWPVELTSTEPSAEGAME